MASISVSEDGLLRKVAGGAGVGGAGAAAGRKPVGGVGGERRPVDEYIASLPSRAAIIGGRTLETLTSLPPLPQPKGQAAGGVGGLGGGTAGGVGIGVNAVGGIGGGINAINTNRGIGAGADNAGGPGGADSLNAAIPYNTIGAAADEAEEVDETEEPDETDEAADAAGAGADKAAAELTPEEQGVVNELRNRDREVRAHEQAHVSAGGAYIRGGVSYQYQRGPDNKSYAVGGEVGIDTAPERDDPGATITKMQTVRAAALAPADPSAQDRAVAAAAARNESAARADLAEEEKPT